MSWVNHENVLGQLQAFGLQVTSLETGRVRRVKAEGDRGKQCTGWYCLHELRTSEGGTLLVGAYGSWREGTGQDGKPVSHKIDLSGQSLSDGERDALRTRIREDRKRAEAIRQRESDLAARHAEAAWRKCSETGSCEYLIRKGVGAHGVRFSPSGNLAIPVQDVTGAIRGLQVIYGDPAIKKKKGRDKDFWPAGITKRGNFHLIGMPTGVLLVSEGYATAASLNEATGLPVAVAFDAGNLLPVCDALHKRYPRAKIVVCGDDDFLTPNNPGLTAASAAALATGGVWCIPKFDEERSKDNKLTDFNDLHQHVGLQAVRAQIEEVLTTNNLARHIAQDAQRGGSPEGGGVGLRPIAQVSELFDRYALIYGNNQTAFDFQERMIVKLSDMRDACIHREIHRQWMESQDKRLVRVDDVGFDPGGTDPFVKCNMWGGWPTVPKSGSCEALLELLFHLCGGEDKPLDLYMWVLRWLAYPIQHPGAKMRTALVLHGPQGVGKNLFFETVMAIYGQYGLIIDQDAVEDKYNDWASKKLFLIADEVVARQELFHMKNKLKGLITGQRIRINPKHIASHNEANHVNVVFMSNETMPLVLERDDRRYVVIWTPDKLPKEDYNAVKAELDAGGVAALHEYLLNLDLGDFNEYTEPPMTRSKRDLIDLSLDSTERFWLTWSRGEIEFVPCCPCPTTELYKLYREWCSRSGISRHAPENRLFHELEKRSKAIKVYGRYMHGASTRQSMFIFPDGQLDPPPGHDSKLKWLTDCAEKFLAGVSQWLNNGSAGGL